MTFQPGQSGNPGGRQKDRPFRDALRMELAAAERDDDPAKVRPNSIRAIARALITKAAGGSEAAIAQIADRLDGKVPQAVVGGGDEGESPVRMIIEWQTTGQSASESPISHEEHSPPSTSA